MGKTKNTSKVLNIKKTTKKVDKNALVVKEKKKNNKIVIKKPVASSKFNNSTKMLMPQHVQLNSTDERSKLIVVPMMNTKILQFIQTIDRRQFINDEEAKVALATFYNNIVLLQNRPNTPFRIQLGSQMTSLVNYGDNKDSAKLFVYKLYQEITGDGEAELDYVRNTQTELSVPINEPKLSLSTVLREYFDNILLPLMKPFDQAKQTLLAQSIYPCLENAAEWMENMQTIIKRDASIIYSCDTILKRLYFELIKNNEINMKKNRRRFGDVLEMVHQEGCANSFVTAMDYQNYYIEQANYTISQVEDLSIFLTPDEASNPTIYKLKACQRGNQCVVHILFNGFNAKALKSIDKNRMVMPRERKKIHLENDEWSENGAYEYCWICNFILSWVEILVHLINNDAKYVTTALFTVLAGTEDVDNSFPLDDVYSFDNPLTSEISNLFGAVLAPEVPFRNFAISQKEDGRFYLKYYRSYFQ